MFGLKKRRRQRRRAQAFPPEWLSILERHVASYRMLPPEDQHDLQRRIHIF